MAKKYKFAKPDNSAVNDTEQGIYGIHPGLYMWRDVKAWVAQGNAIEEFETETEALTRLQKEQAVSAIESATQNARAYEKLQALAAMTPQQVQVWVENDINTLAAAKDAIKTLAVAVCIISKRL